MLNTHFRTLKVYYNNWPNRKTLLSNQSESQENVLCIRKTLTEPLNTFSVVIYAHHFSASRGDNRRRLLYKKEIS